MFCGFPHKHLQRGTCPPCFILFHLNRAELIIEKNTKWRNSSFVMFSNFLLISPNMKYSIQHPVLRELQCNFKELTLIPESM